MGLMYSIPALLRVDPALVDPDLSNVEAAQLFCFDGKATLSIIRSRGHVEIRHWNGGDNARDVNLRGVVFRLVGFRLHVEPRNVVQDDAQLLPPQLTAFVAMAALPTLQKAAEIRVYIERVSRAETHLCLRTDPLSSTMVGCVLMGSRKVLAKSRYRSSCGVLTSFARRDLKRAAKSVPLQSPLFERTD